MCIRNYIDEIEMLILLHLSTSYKYRDIISSVNKGKQCTSHYSNAMFDYGNSVLSIFIVDHCSLMSAGYLHLVIAIGLLSIFRLLQFLINNSQILVMHFIH